jgi:hypothetical protein
MHNVHIQEIELSNKADLIYEENRSGNLPVTEADAN